LNHLFLLSCVFVSVLSSSGQDLARCPYPLPEDIEPCICTVDHLYRMILTCDLNEEFTEERFQKITLAFDYNNNIYSFDIDMSSRVHWRFYPQLDQSNLGQLNITYFSLRNAHLVGSLFGEGAFSGSVGSITNITIEDVYVYGLSVDLGTHALHSACSSLKSLKIERVSQLSNTTLALSPKLVEVSFKKASFPILPSSLFSAQNVPNIQSITVDFSGNNIVRIEEDSFNDLLSLKSLTITKSDIEELPRIVSNSPNLTDFSMTNGNLEIIEENAFSGVPSLTQLTLSGNRNLNHTGLGSSLHFIVDPDAKISLKNTNVRNLDEFVFKPLVETFLSTESATGYVDMESVGLDCACDVKWLILDLPIAISYFHNARCVDGSDLADVDPILLEMLCPP